MSNSPDAQSAKHQHSNSSSAAMHGDVEEGSHFDQFSEQAKESFVEGAREYGEHFVTEPASDLFALAKDYAREKPEVAAFWAFGLGLIVGWKIKPW